MFLTKTLKPIRKTGSLRELLAWGRAGIAGAGFESASLDALVLLAFAARKSKEYIMTRGDGKAGANLARRYARCVRRRINGTPVAYITGIRSFWRHDFFVNKSTLIPKQDTEILVERALDALAERKRSNPAAFADCLTADVCSGSGCVAVSIKAEYPEISLIASDISFRALKLAKKNARAILSKTDFAAKCSRILFLRGDLTEPLRAVARKRGPFDLITANPPYVPSAVAESLLSDGRGEPAAALDGGEDGLTFVRRLLKESFALLRSGGRILLEIGDGQFSAAREYALRCGYGEIIGHKDLSGIDRVAEAVKP